MWKAPSYQFYEQVSGKKIRVSVELHAENTKKLEHIFES